MREVVRDNCLLTTEQERLLSRGEESYLHELKQLKSGGSDDFASKEFFRI